MKKSNCFFLIILMAISINANSQSYSIDFLSIDADLRDCENQTTIISQSDSFNVDVNQSGNSPRGYITSFRGRILDDSRDCEIDEMDTINRSSASSLCDTFEESFNGCCDSFDVTFRIIPDYTILTPVPSGNTALPEVTLEMTPGYDPLVYRWQYRNPTTSQWVLFPSSFIGQSSITFNAQDLFGANASNFIGVSIQYRIELCNGYVPSGFPYIYSFIPQSPEIENVEEINTTCVYNPDGGFTVTFDRSLDSGEELTSLSLVSAGLDDVLDTADDIPNFQSEASATYTENQFTWPQNIPAGRYRLIYQSNGSNSLEEYDPIIITVPPSLEYNIELHNDISCFDEQDGEVIITINPDTNGSVGHGPPYSYTMGDSAPIPFGGNSTSTIVSNLGTTLVEFKVFDSRGCTQREE